MAGLIVKGIILGVSIVAATVIAGSAIVYSMFN